MAVDAIFTHDASVIDGENPLEVGPLNADENELSAWLLVNVKLDTGYESNSDMVIEPEDSQAMEEKWRFAPDDGEGDPVTDSATGWGASFTIDGEEGEIDATTGVDFHVQARATEGESAGTDTSVSINVTSGTAVASA